MKELYSKNKEEISSFMNDLWNQEQKNKSSLNLLWRRNVDFANGVQQMPYGMPSATLNGQNIFFVGGNSNKRTQMYMTNEISPIMRALVSYMTRSKPAVEAATIDKTSESKNRAKLAERVLDAKYEIDNEQNNSTMSVFWALSIGTVFRKDFWDPAKGKLVNQIKYDELGNEVIDPQTGDVMMEQAQSGDTSTAILTPLSVGVDWSVTSFEEQPFINEGYFMPTEWARDVYGDLIGKEKINDSGGFSYESLSVLEQMKYSTPFGRGGETNKTGKDKTLIRELYVKPNGEFPEGRFILKVGDVIAFDGPSPYFLPMQPMMWHPYSVFIPEPFIGRFFGKSMVEDLIPLQMRLNEINGSILENANTLAKVGILAVEGSLKRGVVSGQGAQITTYKNIPGAAKPEKWEGTPLPQQFFKEKQDIIDQMVRRAGTNFVMNGNPPTGVSAGTALEMLLENATSQQTGPMSSLAKYLEQGASKKIRIIRNFNKFPNEDLINYMRGLAKDALDIEIGDFVGEDLGDGFNIKIDPASMIPKSEVSKREAIKQIIANPVLIPEMQEDSPRGSEAREYLFKQIGLDPIETEQSKDLQKAKWENDRIKNGLPPVPWEDDNDPIHLACHMGDYKSPHFIEHASDEIKAAQLEHIEWHKQNDQRKKMQEMQAQMPSGMPPELPPSGPPPGIPAGMPSMEAQAAA